MNPRSSDIHVCTSSKTRTLHLVKKLWLRSLLVVARLLVGYFRPAHRSAVRMLITEPQHNRERGWTHAEPANAAHSLRGARAH
jgi:hypothetical protein